MNALDIFSVITGALSLYVLVQSVCRWVSPIRRLRALDKAVHHLEDLLASMQEDMLFDHRTLSIVRDAHERVFRCVAFRVNARASLMHIPQGALQYSKSPRACLE
jgi:hypothetical protein